MNRPTSTGHTCTHTGTRAHAGALCSALRALEAPARKQAGKNQQAGKAGRLWPF